MALFIRRDARVIPSSAAQVQQRAVWNNDGRELLGRLKGTGTAAIQVSPGIRAVVLDLMARAAPTFAAAVNKEFAPVADNAFEQWPVKTGFSKSVLRLNITVSPDGKEMTVSLSNLAPYAWFINRNRTVMELVFTPGREAAERMADMVEKEIAGP